MLHVADNLDRSGLKIKYFPVTRFRSFRVLQIVVGIDTHSAAQYHEELHYVQLIVWHVKRQGLVKFRLRVCGDEFRPLLFHSLSRSAIEHQYPDVKTWKQQAMMNDV